MIERSLHLLSLAFLGVVLAACATTQPDSVPVNKYENKVAELHTTAGEIDIRFLGDVAPNHVRNFIDLAGRGFYDGTRFHRVIPQFMIQGGDPNTISDDKDTWGKGGSDTTVNAEFSEVPHKRGIVSMARAQDPNSATSQFFIVVADSPFLNSQYSVFGEVTKGMDVADKIANAPRDESNRPDQPVSIVKIVVRDARPGEIPVENKTLESGPARSRFARGHRRSLRGSLAPLPCPL